MKNWVANILTVQQYDMKLRGLETKYRTIPVERGKLRTELQAEAQKLEQARETVRNLDLTMKKTEAEINSLNDKKQKILIQTALVKKQNEYQAMMEDIENTKQQISDLETKVLELMDQQDAAKKALASREKEYAAAERQVKEELKEFDELVETIKTEALKLKAEKKGFIRQCEMNIYEAYKNILTRDTGKPVVPVENGHCGNCSLKVTPQAIQETKKGLLVYCDNCQHILFDPDCEQ